MLEPLRTLRVASPISALALVLGVAALPLLIGLGLTRTCHHSCGAASRPQLLEVEILDDPGALRPHGDGDEAQPDCEPTVHPYLASFTAELDWLSDESLRQIEGIDLKKTAYGRHLPRVDRLAADHAVRHFTPLALEAVGRPAFAARLRRLDRIVDKDTAEAAIRVLLQADHDGVAAPTGRGDPESAVEAVAAAYEALQDVTLRDEKLLEDDCASAYQTNPAAETAALAVDAGADRAAVEKSVVELVRELRHRAISDNYAIVIN